jgi:uncharacterized protein with HEPN domain
MEDIMNSSRRKILDYEWKQMEDIRDYEWKQMEDIRDYE